VINSQGIMELPAAREPARVADDRVIRKGITFGWPDDSFPANTVVSERKPVDQAAMSVGFGD
jgi:hypothetical protein